MMRHNNYTATLIDGRMDGKAGREDEGNNYTSSHIRVWSWKLIGVKGISNP